MPPSPEVDAIKAFAKKHKTKKICINYAKYSRLMGEWKVHFDASMAPVLGHLDWSVSEDDNWAGIFARIDNVDLCYHDGQPEEMRVWSMTKSSSKPSKP